MKAFYSPVAKAILHQIETRGPLTVSDIMMRTALEQSEVSRHLMWFRRAGILYAERDGKWMIYDFDVKRFEQVANAVKGLADIHDGVDKSDHRYKYMRSLV